MATNLKNQALKPVLAGVGVTDLAVEVVRDAVADVQKRLTAAQQRATRTAADPKAVVNARVDAIAKDAQARRTAIEARVADLQSEAMTYPAQVSRLVDDNVAAANAAYADLVKRGESLVGRIRRQESTVAARESAKTTVAKAKTTATQAKKAADAATTATDRTSATKVAPKPRPTAKKATQKAAGKKAAATTARKTAAKKSAVAQGSAKATATAAKKTATNAAQAVVEAAEKVGD